MTPTNEPTELRAGDTWKWSREDLGDYPAPTWTLTYRFKNVAGGFEIVAAASGTAFAVTVAAGTTNGYAAGDYDWQAQVSNGTEKYTVDTGRLKVLPSLFAGAPNAAQDTRSQARIALDNVKAVIAKRATLDQQQYTIGNRQLVRMTIPELILLRDKLQAEVNAEQRAEKIANGMGGGGARIVVRC